MIGQNRDKTIERLQAENAELRSRYVVKKGGGRYFSAHGGMMVALKQSATSAAASAFGIAVGTDVGKDSIYGWQVLPHLFMVGWCSPVGAHPTCVSACTHVCCSACVCV